MIGQVVGFVPKMSNGVHHSFVNKFDNSNMYVYEVTVTVNGITSVGEANSKSLTPWWNPAEQVDIEITPNSNSTGGNKLKISKPKDQGGYQQNAAPPQAPPVTNLPPPPATNAAYPPMPPPSSVVHPTQEQLQSAYQPTAKVPEDIREQLIVAQSAIKAAVSYISGLTETQRDHVLQVHGNKKEDFVAKYSQFIAEKTYEIARSLK